MLNQQLGHAKKALSPLCLLASNKDLARKLAALEVCQASRALMYPPPAKGRGVGLIANLERKSTSSPAHGGPVISWSRPSRALLPVFNKSNRQAILHRFKNDTKSTCCYYSAMVSVRISPG